MARAMVTQYGMTERLGAIKLGESNAEPFLGRDIGHSRNYSEDVAAIVDEETKKLLANAHQEAFDILEENRDVLDALVLALLEQGDPRQGSRSPRSSSRCAGARRGRRGPARPTASPSEHPAGRGPAGDPRPARRRQRPTSAERRGAILTPPGRRRRRPRRARSSPAAEPADDRPAVTA